MEASTYGSELVAAKMAVEAIMELRCQPRMVGVPLDGPAMLYGDKMFVVLIGTTIPPSVLKERMLTLCYQRVREAIATGIIVYQHIRPKHNKADCLTKMLGGTAFHQMVKGILFRTPHRG